MLLKNTLVLVTIIFGNHFCLAASKTKHRMVTDKDGTKYDVTEIIDGDKDVSIIKKDGEIIEQQIMHQNEGYIVFMQNDTCSVEFHDAADTGDCYRGIVPNDDEITAEIREECGDLQIVFVRLAECPDHSKVHTDHEHGGIQKRWPCRKHWYWKLSCGWLGCWFTWAFYWRC
ncbi:uncharacterized protein LOC143077955 [Mytilus galloprovincialis]|uniref:uncharacterized protein LOC143077955 n=1 Tax=Mytilus galloprovincialis TaxID=29158 RepID=UPI003F7BC72F